MAYPYDLTQAQLTAALERLQAVNVQTLLEKDDLTGRVVTDAEGKWTFFMYTLVSDDAE